MINTVTDTVKIRKQRRLDIKLLCIRTIFLF